VRRRRGRVIVAQRDAERLLEPDRGRKRERPPAGQRLLERRDADLRLIGQKLPRDAAAGQLLADLSRDQPALFVRQLGLGNDLHRAPSAPTLSNIGSVQVLTYPYRRGFGKAQRDGTVPNKPQLDARPPARLRRQHRTGAGRESGGGQFMASST